LGVSLRFTARPWEGKILVRGEPRPHERFFGVRQVGPAGSAADPSEVSRSRPGPGASRACRSLRFRGVARRASGSFRRVWSRMGSPASQGGSRGSVSEPPGRRRPAWSWRRTHPPPQVPPGRPRAVRLVVGNRSRAVRKSFPSFRGATPPSAPIVAPRTRRRAQGRSPPGAARATAWSCAGGPGSGGRH
jgi:hypothetical protein